MRHTGDDLWRAAAAFAGAAHKHQTRKDGRTPYVAHPFRVALTVRQVFGCDDPVCLAAALLHDVLEDTVHDYDDLEAEFGREVAAIVSAVSKDMRLPEPEREGEYDARLAKADWRARLIKLADVLDNLCDIAGSRDPEARRKQVARCERAMALAARDGAGHPETARAIGAVRAAVGAG